MTVLDAPTATAKARRLAPKDSTGWMVFTYAPAALFALKPSWATSTAGKTLLTPTPYAVKMAFLDVSLRNGFAGDPNWLVAALANAVLRIGVPPHACVTSTIQVVRQETRDSDRKKKPELPPYRPNIALREVVHFHGTLRFAFERTSCAKELQKQLAIAAPAVNYVGKRGSFLQFLAKQDVEALDGSFTQPVEPQAELPSWRHLASLDDFGPSATFDALNSYSATEIKSGVHRTFVETMVPLGVRNRGPGFVHYTVEPAGML